MDKKNHMCWAQTLLVVSSFCSPFAAADLLKDSKGSLELKNFYFNRDFNDSTAAASKREEWAQGFILNLQSGFTEGTVGFGLDALGLLGVKLDSSPDRSGTGLLSRDSDGRAYDNYSKLELTAKARIAQSELRIGGLNPVLPLLASNNTRLLPQVFNGVQLTSKDIKSLTAILGQVDSVKQRDSTDSEELSASSQSGGYSSAVTSDHYTYAGFDYQLIPSLNVAYQYSDLENLFRRDYVGLKFNSPLSKGRVFAEVRYFDGQESGKKLLGKVDNRTVSSNAGYSLIGHTFSIGYQAASGATAYPYVSGSDTYLFGEMLVSNFALANEDVWYAAYSYDFTGLGVPGLTWNLRYAKGENVDPSNINTVKSKALRASGAEGKEWERVSDLTYVVQSGMFKNISLRWRNSINRSTYADDANENRIMIGYFYNF
ncbi:OprD family porin [Pseudomonas putida]|uniref:Putative porin n=1 Tax=Pseudomonas putida TaxID=303 RepID=A0A1L7NF06_PSEPU|nr:OprD family porin [Pseudomonas putida]BAW24047.1 Putative porin [Pseudomonas putida]